MSLQTITVNIAPLLNTPGCNFKLDIDNDYTVLDLILFLIDYDLRFKDYGIILPKNIRVDPTNIKEKLTKFLKNKILDIKQISIFTPLNSFCRLRNLKKLYENNLLDTVNLGDICPINHAKIGEWIGYGRGPIKVPLEDDNWDISNLVFIIVGTANPVAYNKHCLTKMIDNNSILIPHINKKFKANIFINNINNFINIVKFNSNDTVHLINT